MSGHSHQWDYSGWEYDPDTGEEHRELMCRGCPDERTETRPHTRHSYSVPVPDPLHETLLLRVCKLCSVPNRVHA